MTGPLSMFLSLELLEQVASIVAGILFVLATLYPLLKKRQHYYHVISHWLTRRLKVLSRRRKKSLHEIGHAPFAHSTPNKKNIFMRLSVI
jgi:predicted PurR-regulated permease PerM